MIKYKTAIILSAIILFLGAIIEGPKCMETVGKLSVLSSQTAFFCVFSSAIVMFVMTRLAIPASASQAIIVLFLV